MPIIKTNSQVYKDWLAALKPDDVFGCGVLVAVILGAGCMLCMLFEIGPIGRWVREADARNREAYWQKREAKYIAAGFRVERMTEHGALVLIRADGERFLVTFKQGEIDSSAVVPLAKQTAEETKQ